LGSQPAKRSLMPGRVKEEILSRGKNKSKLKMTLGGAVIRRE